MTARNEPNDGTEAEIARLRAEVQRLRAERVAAEPVVAEKAERATATRTKEDQPEERQEEDRSADPVSPSDSSSTHALLLLSDSALPLGAFAFSSGLESFLAHHPPRSTAPLLVFLEASVAAVARQALPFVRAAWDSPARLSEWDDALDAASLCGVARRQSLEQGRALLGVWSRGLWRASSERSEPSEKSERSQLNASRQSATAQSAISALASLSAALRHSPASSSDPPMAHGHLAPVFGATARALSVNRHDTAYVFLLSHVRGVLSAAVRAGVLGPFAQVGVLSGGLLRGWLEAAIQEEQKVPEVHIEGAGQVTPLLDVWGGRHEVLYSRIFNS